MIIDDLKAKLKQHRLARNNFHISVFSTIIGNITSNAKMVDGVKVVPDADALAYLKKHVKSLEETLALTSDPTRRLDLEFEIKVVSDYLPTQMSESEIREILDHEKFESMKDFMSFMKTNHEGRYDGRLAAKLFNEG